MTANKQYLGDGQLILDACCGGRMFWFDKTNPIVLYVDNRSAEKGHISLSPNHEIVPDEIVDFRCMSYKNNQFKMVVFDPPHMLARKGILGLMAKKYGSLNKDTWKEDLSKGFSECWRVLDVFGTLIFKWSSSEIPLKEVLSCFSEKPLFGHTTTNKGTTHWLCFMKVLDSNDS